MTWTNEQERIFDAVKEGSGNLIVEAVAGSGKTTTLEQALRLTQHKYGKGEVLAIAFSADVKKTFEKKMPKPADKKTFNGLGHSAWAKKVGQLTLDQQKMTNLLKDRDIDDSDVFVSILQLTGLMKQAGVIPPQVKTKNEGLYPNDVESIRELADFYNVDFDGEIYDESLHLLHKSIELAWDARIDFNDQLYMPIIFKAPFKKYQLVVVDEAQDLSPIQHEILKKSVSMQGRIVAVGDTHQAIYGFRGAHTDSMAQLKNHFNMEELDLSVTFRCSQAVTEFAQNIVPHIQHTDDAPKGSVIKNLGWTIEDIPDGAGIICRTNAPILKVAYKLLRQNRAPLVLGRDIGKGLTKLITKLAPKSTDLETFKESLQKWETTEIERARLKEQHNKVGSIMDKAASLRALMEPSIKTTVQLSDVVEKLFNKQSGLITLSTVHKAKGLEFETVYVLEHTMMLPPHPGQLWEQQQEENTRYVAYTRAINDLALVDLEHLEEPEE